MKVVYLAGSWPMVADDKFLPGGSTQNRDSISPDDSQRNIEQGLKNVLIDDWPPLPYAPLDRLRDIYLPARRLLADALSGAPLANPGRPRSPEARSSLDKANN